MKNQALKELWRAVKMVLVLCAFTMTYQVISDGGVVWNNLLSWIISNFYFGLSFYYANGYLNDYLNKNIPWSENPTKRTWIGIIAMIVTNVILTLILMMVFIVVIKNGHIGDAISWSNSFTYIMCLGLVTFFTLLFHAMAFFKSAQASEIRNEQLRKEKVAAELNVLKAQIDPHFLFNSFNVLSGLIDEDQAKAQDFLSGLARIYRYVLENRNEDLTKLEDELVFAEKYMNLQKVRFEDSVMLETKVDQMSLGKKVPALSLQLILENALKHNGFDKEQPLKIEISQVNGHLIIQNNKQRRLRMVSSNGFGLQNIKERYALHGISTFEVDQTEEKFTVKLPLI